MKQRRQLSLAWVTLIGGSASVQAACGDNPSGAATMAGAGIGNVAGSTSGSGGTSVVMGGSRVGGLGGVSTAGWGQHRLREPSEIRAASTRSRSRSSSIRTAAWPRRRRPAPARSATATSVRAKAWRIGCARALATYPKSRFRKVRARGRTRPPLQVTSTRGSRNRARTTRRSTRRAISTSPTSSTKCGPVTATRRTTPPQLIQTTFRSRSGGAGPSIRARHSERLPFGLVMN
jgi:hypothetical protein